MAIKFDIDKLSALMKNFYTLTKIRIVLFDDKFNKILSIPQRDSDFCTIVKNNPTLGERCKRCDKEARNDCLTKNSLHLYTCHAGLIEAISPLKMNDMVLGYIMLGQVMEKSEKTKNKDKILNYVNSYIDSNLEEQYKKLTSKDKKQINAAASIMETCACYLWVSRLIEFDGDSFASLISSYIKDNLTSDLSVETLCSHFALSRNKLYKLSHEAFGMSIASYVRKLRIENAAALLKNGYSVSNAAICSGFDDYNYFSKQFKAETGILPSKFKNSL